MSDEQGNDKFPTAGGDDNQDKEPTHVGGVRAGNEMATEKEQGKEAGRSDAGTSGADRPAGGSTSRDSTGVNPKDPIDPESPNFPSE